MVEMKQLNDRPSGRAISLEDNRIQRIRNRSSYLLFRQLHDFLKTNPDIATVLRKFYAILDIKGGFGSIRNAEYAAESLDWVLRDVGKDGQRSYGDSEVS